MAPAAFLLPDVLVLAAGGVVGEAWMTGVLAGLEHASGVDLRRVETIVGTSAGSIVAASLVAGRRPRRPRSAGGSGARRAAGERERTARARGALGGLVRSSARAAWMASAPLAAPALALGVPGGALARSLVLARIPTGRRGLDGLRRQVDGAGARFDGRLRIVAVDRQTGRRVVFGSPSAPDATVGEAVAASCAVPWIFRPVRIGGREYVDGGVWSLTNLDVAPARRNTDVLCLSVTASASLSLAAPLSALRGAARAGEAVETLALSRRGANVRTIGPDAEAARAIGMNLMDPAHSERALAAGYAQGLRAA